MNRKSYIYLLSDPSTGQPKYIGKTINPIRRRLYYQAQPPKHQKSLISSWLREILDSNLKPIFSILCICKVENENKFEKYYISKYKKKFKLLNQRSGGNGWNNISNKKFNTNIEPAKLAVQKKIIAKHKVTNKELVFQSVLEASKFLNAHPTWISSCLNKVPKKLSVKGYYVRYFNEPFVLIKHKYYRGDVVGTNIKTGKKLYFTSTYQVKNFGFSRSCVVACCNKRIHRLTHKGYKWEYINEKNPIK